MAYEVEFDKRACKDLERLSRDIAREIVRKCSSILPADPLWGPGIKHLPHLKSNLYRLKVKHVWRVAYLIEGPRVTVILVGHRRDFYQRLPRRT